VIDRAARDIAAEVVRRFISGQITNLDFEEKMPSSCDRAISAIEVSLWPFYDDLKSHKLSGAWRIPDETKSEMARWVIFLHTNEEYLWPEVAFPGIRPLHHGFISKMFGGPEREQKFMQAGIYSVWPFFSNESFQLAKQNPVLLAGS
jgi:hypothetical protein